MPKNNGQVSRSSKYIRTRETARRKKPQEEQVQQREQQRQRAPSHEELMGGTFVPRQSMLPPRTGELEFDGEWIAKTLTFLPRKLGIVCTGNEVVEVRCSRVAAVASGARAYISAYPHDQRSKPGIATCPPRPSPQTPLRGTQAAAAGVRRGWRITSINGKPAPDDDEAWRDLGWAPCGGSARGKGSTAVR